MQTNEVRTSEETKDYDCFTGGIITKHWVTYHYPRPVTLVHYTATKHNGETSKKYTRIGNATNWLGKK